MASTVPIDPVLSNLSVATWQDSKGFIADKVFPTVPVEVQSGQYYVLDDENLNRDTAERRADATESAGDSFVLSDDAYNATVFALHKDVGDQLQSNYRDVPGTPFQSATKFLVNKMRLRQEVLFANDFMSAGIWGLDEEGKAATPSTDEFIQWDKDGSDPIADLERWKEAVSAAGFDANVLAIGKPIWTALKNHPDIIDRYKYTSGGAKVSLEAIADLLDLERIVVGRAIRNTAKRGQPATNELVIGKKALLVHTPDAPGIEVPAAGYTFAWTGVSDGLGENIGTKQFRMEHLGADRVESQIALDNKLVGASLGVFADAVVS
jgi:hypothetical protein